MVSFAEEVVAVAAEIPITAGFNFAVNRHMDIRYGPRPRRTISRQARMSPNVPSEQEFQDHAGPTYVLPRQV